jgi:hypothetical protein
MTATTDPRHRSRFVEIAEAVRRQCGHPADPFDADPANDLTLTVEVGGVWFEIVHAAAGSPFPATRMGIRAILGIAPREGTDLLENLLRANQHTTRMGGGSFAMDPQTQELLYCFSDPLDIGADGLMQGLAQAAEQIAALQARWPHLVH